jgi:hypothetical protein
MHYTKWNMVVLILMSMVDLTLFAKLGHDYGREH